MRQLFALLCHSKVFKSTGLGQPKHVKLTGDSKLGAGVNGALSLSVLASYTANLSRLYPISSLFTAGINFSCTQTLNWISGKKWMDGVESAKSVKYSSENTSE